MRSVVVTATLFATFVLGTPWVARAQQEAEGQASPRAGAVRRPAPTAAREQDARTGDRASGRRSSGDAGAAGRVRAPEPSTSAPASPAGAVERRRAETSTGTSVAAEEQQSGAQRRGRVRNPSGDQARGDNRGARDRAVPRTSAPRGRDVFVYPYPRYRYYGYTPYYAPWGYGGFGLGYFSYSPWGPGYYGGHGGYGGYYGRRGYYAPYGYDLGRVKLKVRPRDAEVFVDGYYAGIVDDFDGIFQALKLDGGGYRIEIRKPGYEPLQFDVRVQPDRTMTLRGDLRQSP